MKQSKVSNLIERIYNINELKGYYLISVFFVVQLIDMIPMFSEPIKPIKNMFFGFVIVSFVLLLLKNKRLVTSKGNFFLVLFLLWYLIVIYINRDINIQINIKYYLYMLLQMIVLVNYFNYLESPEKKKNTIISVLTTASIILLGISLVLYLFNYEYSIVVNDSMYVIGVEKGRLTGLFGNSNLIAVLASVCIFVEVLHKKKKAHNIVVIILLVLCLSLSQSRGTITAFAISFASFYTISGIKKFKKIITVKNIMKFTVIFFTSTLLLFSIASVGGLITKSHNSINAGNDNLGEDPDESEVGSSEEIAISDRTYSDSLRKKLFLVGLKVFEDYPVVGVTSSNIGIHAAPYIGEDFGLPPNHPILKNPHNLEIQILASSGVVGMVIILIYLYFLMKESILYLYKKNYSELNIIYMAIILFFIIIGQLECYIMFNSSLFASIFWFVSGSLTNSLILRKSDDYLKAIKT